MSGQKRRETGQAVNVFQFSLAGLVIFSLALVAISSFVGFKLTGGRLRPVLAAADMGPNIADPAETVRIGAWGTIVSRNIEIERPIEYLTAEVSQPAAEVWSFAGQTPDAVKELFAKCGLTAAQVAEAFVPSNTATVTGGFKMRPSARFLLSLTPAQRHDLFTAMAGHDVNLYIDYPYIFPGDSLLDIYSDRRLNPADVALLKQLIYPNGTSQQLSDYAFLLDSIPTLERRTALTQALSRQSAVLARLRIAPDTDIDKIALYWGNIPGVRFTDVRPLLESLKALPGGGSISLLYLLPKFARDRLYTFPLPSKAGDPVMDCHWSTFNFCNDSPDNRYNDPTYTVDYIRNHYYEIATPSMYGDILLLMNNRGEVKHSAVYLADDIVFTKNGNNYRQPWMLMHIPDLLATYPANPPMRPVYMRLRSE